MSGAKMTLSLSRQIAVLRADAVVPTDDAARRVSRLLPESVMDAVVVNMARLPETAHRLASAVAVFGQAPVPLAAELDITSRRDLATALPGGPASGL